MNKINFKRFASQISIFSATGTPRWTQTLFIYVVSHGFMLASWNAYYWDDWKLYANGTAGVESYLSECQDCTIPFRSEVEGLLISLGPWPMRIMVFAVFPVIALLTFQFLRRTDWMPKDEAGMVSLLTLFMPMFGARVANINFQYSISLFLFVLGAWMSLSPRAVVRLSAFVPIFWSLFTPSLQVFVVVPLAVLCIRLVRKLDKSNLHRSTLLVVVLLGLSPFAHRYLIPTLFPSLRVTNGYNTIQPEFLMRGVVASALLSSPLMILLHRQKLRQSVARESWLLSLGLAVLAAGTFPYLAVGHFANLSDWIIPILPDESDWSSRHQLLQPFGLALSLVAISRMFGARSKAALNIFLIVSIGINVATYSGYYLDSKKQEEFIAAMEESKAELSSVTDLIIDDQARRFNARGRNVRAYEWTAMIARATGLTLRVDEDYFQFCHEPRRTRSLTISALNGRLRSLVTGSIGISVKFADLPTCSSS